MYRLCFYVPASHVEQVRSAVFAVGAGKIGDYNCCAWQVEGQGQFRPLEGSDPFMGEQGGLETVAEYRVEMVVEDKLIAKALDALKAAHPYEEPAYQYWQVNPSLD